MSSIAGMRYVGRRNERVHQDEGCIDADGRMDNSFDIANAAIFYV